MAEEEVPLTKERLFTMMAGYKATAVLRACVELELFDPLADGPADAATLARRLGVDERALSALLAAAAGVGLLVRGEDGYALPAGAAELLVTSEPGYCAGISSVVASQLEWTALGSLAGTVRRGGPVPGFDLLAPDFPYWTDFATHSTFVTTVLSGDLADQAALLGMLARLRAMGLDVVEVRRVLRPTEAPAAEPAAAPDDPAP